MITYCISQLILEGIHIVITFHAFFAQLVSFVCCKRFKLSCHTLVCFFFIVLVTQGWQDLPQLICHLLGPI